MKRSSAEIVQNSVPELEREKISAFIIAFNEEAHIRECVESVSFCDEVLVVDSFSTDKTVELAEAAGAKVIQRKWPGYRAQKAFALESVSNEWVLNLDADERVSPELKGEVESILEARAVCDDSSQPIGYEVNRLVHYLGRWWNKGGWYPEYRLRFFKKSQVTWGGVDPHEKPIPHGATSKLSGDLYHYTYKDMNDQVNRLNSFSSIMSKEHFDIGKRASIFNLIFNPIARFSKFYLFKGGFKEGKAGFIVAVIEAYYTFLKYAKLWECEFKEREK